MSEQQKSERHRIDVWLKQVCLFKHRTDATEACKGGKVKVNGLSTKPAAVVREGDVVEITLGEHFRRVVVQAIPEGNVSKEIARTMYLDQTPERPKIDRTAGVTRDRGLGRPTKRERRELDRFNRR
jgi:ribosome-associated heat shock protein Hsp15